MFSLAGNLKRNDLEFLPIEISLKKAHANNLDFLSIQITSKKLRGKNVDRQNYVKKKVRGKNVDFSINEITSKKYVEITWKFVEIWSLKYRLNIDVESKSIQRGVPSPLSPPYLLISFC